MSSVWVNLRSEYAERFVGGVRTGYPWVRVPLDTELGEVS